MWNRAPLNRWEYENRYAVKFFPRTDFLGVKVETKKALFHGKPYKDLSARERRKWENMLIIGFPKDRIRVQYE